MSDWDEARIAFRSLTREDLPLLRDWINRPHVRPWFGEGTEPYSHEEIAADYGRDAPGHEHIDGFIAAYDGQPVGWVQRYFPHLEPDYWGRQNPTLPPGIAGIDLLIGDPAFLHRGFGPVLIRAFLRTRVFADPAVPGCLIDPDPANTAAIRAYEKVGFRHDRTIGPPDHCEPAYVMLLGRDELFATRG